MTGNNEKLETLKQFFQTEDASVDIGVVALMIKLLEDVRNQVSELKQEQHSIVDSFSLMEKNAVAFEETLRKHAEDSAARHKQVMGAFPAEDIEGHRRYHESLIEWRELRNKAIKECLVNLAKVGTVVGSGWVLITLFTAFKFELKKWLG